MGSLGRFIGPETAATRRGTADEVPRRAMSPRNPPRPVPLSTRKRRPWVFPRLCVCTVYKRKPPQPALKEAKKYVVATAGISAGFL